MQSRVLLFGAIIFFFELFETYWSLLRPSRWYIGSRKSWGHWIFLLLILDLPLWLTSEPSLPIPCEILKSRSCISMLLLLRQGRHALTAPPLVHLNLPNPQRRLSFWAASSRPSRTTLVLISLGPQPLPLPFPEAHLLQVGWLPPHGNFLVPTTLPCLDSLRQVIWRQWPSRKAAAFVASRITLEANIGAIL